MGRTLSGPTAAAVARTLTQPGALLQIGFSSTLRYSSRGDVTWNSLLWQNNNLRVTNLAELPNGGSSCTVVIGNTDRAFGALCLAEAPQDKPITAWAFYEGAVAVGDPVAIFSGVIDTCDITEQVVTLTCSDLNARTLFIPRERITRAAGFNRLMPAAKVIEWNGQRLEINRGL